MHFYNKVAFYLQFVTNGTILWRMDWLLLQVINNTIRKMKSDGTLRSLHKKYGLVFAYESQSLFLVHIRLWKLFTEWWQSQLCQTEVHLSKGNTDDGDAENETVKNMGEPDPDAAHEEP